MKDIFDQISKKRQPVFGRVKKQLEDMMNNQVIARELMKMAKSLTSKRDQLFYEFPFSYTTTAWIDSDRQKFDRAFIEEYRKSEEEEIQDYINEYRDFGKMFYGKVELKIDKTEEMDDNEYKFYIKGVVKIYLRSSVMYLLKDFENNVKKIWG